MKPKIFCYKICGMKLEIFYYESYNSKTSYLAIIKNEYVVNIACSEKGLTQFSEENSISKKDFCDFTTLKHVTLTEVQVRDLALYTHWPVHTKEFWDLLNET